MPLFEGLLLLVLLGLVGTFAVLMVLAYLREGGVEAAARRTTNQILSVLVGAGAVTAAVAAEGLSVLAEVPAAAVTAIGLGSIMAGLSPEVFLAVSVTSYIVLAAISGEV